MGEENEGLTSMSLSILSSVLEQITTHTPSAVVSLAVGVIAGAIGSQLYTWHKGIKAKQNFTDKTLELEDIVIGITEFKKTNENHPVTGDPFYRQCLTTPSKQNLKEFFPDPWVDLVINNLEEAKKRCDKNNPCVLLHLADIINDGENDDGTTIETLNNELTNGISALFNNQNKFAVNSARLKSDEEVAYNTHVPFLISEECAKKQQRMKILIIPLQNLIDGKIENLASDHLFYYNGYDEHGDEVYSNIPNHPQASRHETFKKLIELYRENRDNFQPFKIYKDEIRKIDHDSYVLQHDAELA